MKCEEYDVIIVGTGAAGLFAALNLPDNCNILMITKDEIEHSDSYLAQGGISSLLDENDYEVYFEDTMNAGKNENNKDAVAIMIKESKEIIEDLCHYGVKFDRDEKGNVSYTREGAHSTYRILHHKDQTGKEITSNLIKCAEQKANIRIIEHETMVDIVVQKNQCVGIVSRDHDGKIHLRKSRATILATGGIGGLFNNSTNFGHITGDSFAIALKHHVELENIHYIQIHPTVLYSDKPGRRFLISESVRGEGAILLNENKERFVDELLPRDVVTDAIRKEMEKFGTKYVYLSLQNMDKEEAKTRFPYIYEKCLEEGYDLSEDLVPVTPAQHYLMGGIKASTNGESSMENLFAVGETACNGVHGANRLASNSLLESLVFAKRAAKKIQNHLNDEKIETNILCDISEEELQQRYKPDYIQREYKDLIMDEIKKKDGEFYDKWCNNEN